MTRKLDERKDTDTRKRFNQSDYQWTQRQAFPNFISRVEIIYSLDYLWLCDLSFSNKYHCLSVCWSTLWSTCSYVSVSLVLSNFQVIYCINSVFGISLATITLFSTRSPHIERKDKAGFGQQTVSFTWEKNNTASPKWNILQLSHCIHVKGYLSQYILFNIHMEEAMKVNKCNTVTDIDIVRKKETVLPTHLKHTRKIMNCTIN